VALEQGQVRCARQEQERLERKTDITQQQNHSSFCSRSFFQRPVHRCLWSGYFFCFESCISLYASSLCERVVDRRPVASQIKPSILLTF
jgi:demethoxyubiquinone hydroxylase (CLK1/Coq7/Cat5 family)